MKKRVLAIIICISLMLGIIPMQQVEASNSTGKWKKVTMQSYKEDGATYTVKVSKKVKTYKKKEFISQVKVEAIKKTKKKTTTKTYKSKEYSYTTTPKTVEKIMKKDKYLKKNDVYNKLINMKTKYYIFEIADSYPVGLEGLLKYNEFNANGLKKKYEKMLLDELKDRFNPAGILKDIFKKSLGVNATFSDANACFEDVNKVKKLYKDIMNDFSEHYETCYNIGLNESKWNKQKKQYKQDATKSAKSLYNAIVNCSNKK